MRKAIAILSLLFAVGAAQAQTAEVPFKLINGSIFVDATVDSIEGRYFVDTGAPMALLHHRAQKSNYQPIGRMPIIDPRGQKTEGVPVVLINSLEMGQFRTSGGLQVLVLGKGDNLEMTGADGVIGSNFLTQMVVRFDPRREVIILSGSVEPYGLSEEDGIPMRVGAAGHVFVNIDMGNGVVEEAMFDSGSKNLFEMSGGAYERLAGGPAIEIIDESRRVKIHEFNVGSGKFTDATAGVLRGGPVSLLGAELLKYGIVTLDYPRQRFYFEPFSDEPVDAYEAVWDVRIMSVGGELRVASVSGDADPRIERHDLVAEVDGVEYKGDKTVEFLAIQRDGTATERLITIRKKDGTEFTATSRKR